MNVKHELFAQAIIKHKGHLSLAYQEAYPLANPESARHGGSALWKKVEIQTRVNELLEAQGLGIVELTKKLKDLTEAKKIVMVNRYVRYEPDNTVILEAIKTGLRIHGLLGNKSDIAIYLSPEQLVKGQETFIEKEID